MQLLGNYQSTLTEQHYQQLVDLLKSAIAAGDFGGGSAFDQAALENLQKQSQDFSSLPTPSAGQVATEETFNRPLTLLTAQFAALLAESNAFGGELQSLLDVLDKDTGLIDQLLAQAAVERWAGSIPALGGSTQIMWDFGVGYGPVAETDLPNLWSDPSNGVTYKSRPPLIAQLADASGIQSGLAPSSSVGTVPVNNLVWTYTAAAGAQVESLNQGSWAKLSILEPAPLVNFSPTPVVNPAASPFEIAGTSLLGALPVYVQTSFVQRRNQLSLVAENGVAVYLSPYTVETDQVKVFIGTGSPGDRVLTQGTDYTVDTLGTFTPLTLNGPTQLAVFFVEEFPGYRCSIDQAVWSDLRMLDPMRPYPDDETEFTPVAFTTASDGTLQMPVTDELGNPSGFYIRLKRPPQQVYLLAISSPASPDTVGATAVLEADMAQLAYINALRITPFTTFPMVLKKIDVQGLSTNTRQSVWDGSVAIDRPTSIRLDQPIGSTPLVSKVFLTFYQPNYSIKQQIVTPPDALRRDVMSRLQAVLPFNARTAAPAAPATQTGAQYEFGVENVTGEVWAASTGAFVSGPSVFSGCPELIRFDDQSFAIAGAHSVDSLILAPPATAVDFYLCYRAYDATGVVVDENLVGVALVSGQTVAFPFSGSLALASVASVDIYVKIVHRAIASVCQRYLLQITSR